MLYNVLYLFGEMIFDLKKKLCDVKKGTGPEYEIENGKLQAVGW